VTDLSLCAGRRRAEAGCLLRQRRLDLHRQSVLAAITAALCRGRFCPVTTQERFILQVSMGKYAPSAGNLTAVGCQNEGKNAPRGRRARTPRSRAKSGLLGTLCIEDFRRAPAGTAMWRTLSVCQSYAM